MSRIALQYITYCCNMSHIVAICHIEVDMLHTVAICHIAVDMLHSLTNTISHIAADMLHSAAQYVILQ